MHSEKTNQNGRLILILVIDLKLNSKKARHTHRPRPETTDVQVWFKFDTATARAVGLGDCAPVLKNWNLGCNLTVCYRHDYQFWFMFSKNET